MSPDIRIIDTGEWVGRAAADPIGHRGRQAIEVALHAIARLLPEYRLFLKGGLLMGLVHESPRMSVDIDLTAGFPVRPDIAEDLGEALGRALRPAAAGLGHTDLTVNVHSVRKFPSGRFETGSFPALKIKMEHSTPSGSGKRRTGYFTVDVSFNEPLREVMVLRIAEGRDLYAYDVAELIAEKYRAILQQAVRRRNRRQDVYDIHHLTSRNEIDAASGQRILEIMLAKSRSRGLEPKRDSLADPETRLRSRADWTGIDVETGGLPDFDVCYGQVRSFYESLPWPR